MVGGARDAARTKVHTSLRGQDDVNRTYSEPGRYSEVLRITDKTGNVGYDFAVIVVMDRAHPERLIPSIHPNYYPTSDIHPAVLLQTPYNKNGQATRARNFAARGYVVVNVDSRGRFESGGDWDR